MTFYVESNILGDVLQDGRINMSDINAIVDHILGRTTLAGASLENADYNSDSMIDAGDVVALIGLLN